jgi:hypothetical protein
VNVTLAKAFAISGSVRQKLLCRPAHVVRFEKHQQFFDLRSTEAAD